MHSFIFLCSWTLAMMCYFRFLVWLSHYNGLKPNLDLEGSLFWIDFGRLFSHSTRNEGKMDGLHRLQNWSISYKHHVPRENKGADNSCQWVQDPVSSQCQPWCCEGGAQIAPCQDFIQSHDLLPLAKGSAEKMAFKKHVGGILISACHN